METAEAKVMSQLRTLLKRGAEHKTWTRQLNTLREQVGAHNLKPSP